MSRLLVLYTCANEIEIQFTNSFKNDQPLCLIKALQACNIPRHGIYIFNAKKNILKLDLFMQSFKKFGKEMPKIESEKTIYNVNQGP